MRAAVRWWGALGLIGAMLGCSPSMNWRAVRMEGVPLSVLLPCKPDHAQREVNMAGQPLMLAMQGCDAGGATFAVSHVVARDTTQAQTLMAAWKTAVLAHVQATDVQERPFEIPNGWNTPQSVRLQAMGKRGDGSSVVLYAAWLARVDASGVHLFHATLFAPKEAPDWADTFLSSLAVP